MDIEEQVLLADVHMDGVKFSIARLRAPFCVSTAPGPVSYCYLLRKGRLWLEVGSAEPALVALEPGTIVGLTGAIPHRFRSGSGPLRVKEERLVTRDFAEEHESDTPYELIVGEIPQEALALSGLFLGAMVLSPTRAEKVCRRIWKAADLVEEELQDTESMGGSSLVIRRLAELMLINISRWVISQATSEEAGGLRALADMRILRAMAAFSAEPQKSWTVKELADIAGMSRTAFSERFHDLIGLSPLQCVTRMRLRTASTALTRGGQNLEEVAAAAGYSSAAAFIRAFRREFQTTPARWRANRGPDIVSQGLRE